VITKLNLASRPFRNRTLPYLISLVLLFFALGGAVWAVAKWNDIRQRNEILKAQISETEKKTQELNRKGELVQQELTPEQKALLVGAHKLVANKSFGWSRLFADLEAVLPGSVSASRIAVENVFKDGDRLKADLEFSVLSRDYPSVEQMINNMNNSGIFKAELRSQDFQKTERLAFTEYTLHLIYTPREGYSMPLPASELVQNQGGAE
jgi:Tfp pilus assembly protein PilN